MIMSKKFRHLTFRNECIIVAGGELELDENGFVTNQEILGLGDEVIAGIYGMVDDADFPIAQYPLEPSSPVAPEGGASEGTPEGGAPEGTPEGGDSEGAKVEEVGL